MYHLIKKELKSLILESAKWLDEKLNNERHIFSKPMILTLLSLWFFVWLIARSFVILVFKWDYAASIDSGGAIRTIVNLFLSKGLNSIMFVTSFLAITTIGTALKLYFTKPHN